MKEFESKADVDVVCCSELMSCSEDGSVRMWEIQDLPLAAEPASPGLSLSHTHTHTLTHRKNVYDI